VLSPSRSRPAWCGRSRRAANTLCSAWLWACWPLVCFTSTLPPPGSGRIEPT